jgi:heme A synthase
MHWSPIDFITAAVLLTIAVFAVWLIMKNFRERPKKAVLGAVVFFAIGLLWAQLAVGIFD